MSDTKQKANEQHGGVPVPEAGRADGRHAPRRMTFRENVILTIKVLAGFGVLGAALWAVNLWTGAQ